MLFSHLGLPRDNNSIQVSYIENVFYSHGRIPLEYHLQKHSIGCRDVTAGITTAGEGTDRHRTKSHEPHTNRRTGSSRRAVGRCEASVLSSSSVVEAAAPAKTGADEDASLRHLCNCQPLPVNNVDLMFVSSESSEFPSIH
jgi:hypothetical protein